MTRDVCSAIRKHVAEKVLQWYYDWCKREIKESDYSKPKIRLSKYWYFQLLH